MVFVNVTATTEIYTDLHTLSLHDALPIYQSRCASSSRRSDTEIQTARRRPLSQLSRMMPATWRPLPAPVPSPRNHPRRNFTASSASSGAAVTTSKVASTFQIGKASWRERVGQSVLISVCAVQLKKKQ